MRVRQLGGMTEFIPSPQEKRDALVRDYSLQLLALLNHRLREIEEVLGFDLEAAVKCDELFTAIRHEENQNIELNMSLDETVIRA